MGLAGLHFHDVRHTGDHLAAQTPGATLRDLMVRMGHGSVRAALIYQHASRDADRHIDDSLSDSLRSCPRTRVSEADLARRTVRHVGRGIARRLHGGDLRAVAKVADRASRPDLRRLVERVTRIELALSAWEADVLPLNYTRGGTGTC